MGDHRRFEPTGGFSTHPRDYVNRVMGKMDEKKVAKVLHGNAAKLYGFKALV
jgi:hypothetical protein